MSISNPQKLTPEAQAGYRNALILTFIHIAFTITLLIMGLRISVMEMVMVAGVTGFIAVASGLAAYFSSRNKPVGSAWLIVVATCISVPLIPFFTSGFGWISFIAVPAIVILAVTETLVPRQRIIAIILGFTAGSIALILDLFAPDTRRTFPNANIIGPFVAGAILLLVAVIVIRRFTNMPLGTKILIIILVVGLVPLATLTFLINQATQATLIDNASQNLSAIALQTSDSIDAYLNTKATTVEQEAKILLLREYINATDSTRTSSREELLSLLSILRNKDPEYTVAYALLDRDLQTVEIFPFPEDQVPVEVGTDTRNIEGYLWTTPAVESGFRNTLLTQIPYISPVLFYDDNQPLIYFAAPVLDIDGSSIGVLVAQFDAAILQVLIEDHNGLAGQDSFGVLFDENQLHIGHGIAPETLYKTVDELPKEQVTVLQGNRRLPNWPPEDLSTDLPELSEKLGSTEAIFTATDVATGDEINQVAQQKMTSKPWKVAFFQPQSTFLSAVDAQTEYGIVFLIIVAGLLGLASLGATRLITAPISNLTDLVEHIASSDMSVQVPVTTEDEIGRLARAFNSMTSQVRSLLSGLETQVAQRTQELERRAVQLRTAAEVARDASALQNLDELLNSSVEIISDRFGFYHVGIFLVDEQREFAIMRASNSEGGRVMLEQGHKLTIGQTGIVGYVASLGEPRIALDVDRDAAHYAQPLLPLTRSEMALPFKIGANVIGVLDVQSDLPDAFDESDIEVLQVMADQLAVAIENTRLLSEVQTSVQELRTASGELTRETWQRWTRRAGGEIGYRYRGLEIEPSAEKSPQAVQALRENKVIVTAGDPNADNRATLAVPIELREQTFGVINLQFDDGAVPPEIVTILGNVADRMAAALESARLYEETQRRAAQEQITGEIAGRIRETLDIDAMLRTAVQEIGSQLDLNDISIQFNPDQDSNPERDA